jgi:DNA-binding IclR family transcriptional regulator
MSVLEDRSLTGASFGDEIEHQPSRSPVLHRAADILNSFDESHLVLSLHDLSERAHLPKSTAHRFVEQLVELGWLERAVDGYRIGMRLFEVGGLVERRNRLRDAALPYMHNLSSRLSCVVHLGILDTHEVLCVEKVPCPDFRIPTREGGRMPVHSTAMGKAILAFSSDDTIDEIVSGGLPSKTARTIVDPEQFRTELAAIRASGIAFDREESQAMFSCVAVPIRNSGKAIGALSMTGATATFDFPTAIAMGRGAAVEIWRDLFDPRVRYPRERQVSVAR